MKLVFATNNPYKFEEIQEITDSRINLLRLSDLGFTEEIPEDYHSLEGNAVQKAFFIYERFGINCFADDTGLEIEALNNEPGVFSARYAGKDCTYEDNIQKVLEKMKGKVNRKACFRTVISLVEHGNISIFAGEINGIITRDKRGQSGFGYDPIFQPEGYKKTFAEMLLSEKNKISHRKIAIHKLVDYLLKNEQYNKAY